MQTLQGDFRPRETRWTLAAMRATKNTTMHTVQGWVILHPDGWVETDYFHRQGWEVKGKKASRETWRKTFRPSCVMVRATLSYEIRT